MQRNRTICALSRAMVLVEARPGSGTLAAGEDALRMGLPLFTVDFAEPSEANAGNRELHARGGQALRQSRTLGRANIQPVLESVHRDRGRAGSRAVEVVAEQRALWNGKTP